MDFVFQVSALEIQTQQLQTILTKRANDTRAATTANDQAFGQVTVQANHAFVEKQTRKVYAVMHCNRRLS